jgi:REP element-mobilizing transposase RayT
LRDFDYSTVAAYFVTVCTHNRRCLLGEGDDGKVCLSPIGLIVRAQIGSLPARLAVEVDAFVIMPNHVHAVVALKQRARQASPLRLGIAIGSLKSGSARELGAPLWQRGFYDHIIRDEADLERVRGYIATNPIQWATDPENPRRVP